MTIQRKSPLPKKRKTARRRLAGCPVLRCKRSPYRRGSCDNLCSVHLRRALDKKARAKCLENYGTGCQADLTHTQGLQLVNIFGISCSADTYTPSIQWAHIVRRGRGITRWMEGNALPLCAAHHSWFTRNPEAWTVFVDDLIGVDAHRHLMRRSLADEKVDLEVVWNDLHK